MEMRSFGSVASVDLCCEASLATVCFQKIKGGHRFPVSAFAYQKLFLPLVDLKSNSYATATYPKSLPISLLLSNSRLRNAYLFTTLCLKISHAVICDTFGWIEKMAHAHRCAPASCDELHARDVQEVAGFKAA
jgi:hypothetical protein